MFRRARISGFLILLLGLGLAATPKAHAVQAGGSLSLIPSNWGFLATGDTFDMIVRVNNTSSDTLSVSFPADTTNPKAAALSGPITVTLGCTDDACSTINTGVLQFVAVGGNGCVAKNAAVTTCAGTANGAVINFGSVLTVPAAGSVDIATIRVKVLDATLVPQIGIQAMTNTGALVACSTALPSLCVGCHADGCTKVAFTAGGNFHSCPHHCPSKITFRQSGINTFELHADIDGSVNFDPGTNPFTITVSNPGFNPVFTYSLPAGALIPGTDSWKYLNNTVKQTGMGINIITVGHRDKTTNRFRLNLIVYDPTLAARIPHGSPNSMPLTTTIMVGGDTFTDTQTWDETNFGWTILVP